MNQTEDLKDLLGDFANPEPLHPDLEARVVEMSSGMVFIKHPLVNTFHTPAFNKMHNAQYEAKKIAVAEAETEGNWRLYVLLHERPWRFEALTGIADRITDTTFWELVADVWTDSENIRENYFEWDELLRTDRPGHEAMMTDEERDALAALPDEIQIWQGHTDERDDGWSWTTKQATAEWFARRFANFEDGEPHVTTATVNKADVLAYFLGRGEEEILVAPEAVVHVQVTVIEKETP